ncbi:hypothetical protein [Brevundimonas subvibrioides]|uniref:hypothetical protein n=1 Tax=Brevundimonas subvibrioides TaxID=74313 RepID=UPI0022B48BD5|nr:hypothetical protein [Brevundimonas subvibrioides]
MLDTLYLKLALLPMILIGLFAFSKGDFPERFGMGVYMLSWLASVLVQDDGNLYESFQLKIFLIDLGVAVFFGYLMWRWARNWIVWAMALQLLTVMSHIVYLFDVRPPVAAFYTVINLTSYGILLTIGIGTFWAWQDRRAAGLE